MNQIIEIYEEFKLQSWIIIITGIGFLDLQLTKWIIENSLLVNNPSYAPVIDFELLMLLLIFKTMLIFWVLIDYIRYTHK